MQNGPGTCVIASVCTHGVDNEADKRGRSLTGRTFYGTNM